MFRRTLTSLCAVCCLGLTQAPHMRAAAKSRAERYFDSIKTDPVRLRAFLQAMPKGGDLHNHVTGAVYAESYIQWAAELGLCVDGTAVALVECSDRATRPAKDAFGDPVLYRTLIDALSVRTLGVAAPRKAGRYQFVDTFSKFNAVADRRRGESLAEIVRRAGAQHVFRLELSSTWDLDIPLAAAGKVAALPARSDGKDPLSDLGALHEQLMTAGLRSASKSAYLDRAEGRAARARQMPAAESPSATSRKACARSHRSRCSRCSSGRSSRTRPTHASPASTWCSRRIGTCPCGPDPISWTG